MKGTTGNYLDPTQMTESDVRNAAIEASKQYVPDWATGEPTASPEFIKDPTMVAAYMAQKNLVGNMQESQIEESPLVSTTFGLDVPTEKDLEKLYAEQAVTPTGIVDTSVGVTPSTTGGPTSVATARTLTTTGEPEYRQFTGVPYTGGMVQGDVGTGTAGLVVTPTGSLRKIDGTEGNPYFLGNQSVPAARTTVAPYKAIIPEFGKEVTLDTTDLFKARYNLWTGVEGKPVETYLGYRYIGGGTAGSENFFSSLSKGIKDIPESLLTMATTGGYALTKLPFDWIFSGDEKALSNMSSFMADWNKNVTSAYRSFMSSGPSEDGAFHNRLGYALPNAAASLGLLTMARIIGGIGGLAGATALLNMGDTVDIAIRSSVNGVSPSAALTSGYIGGALNSALDLIGLGQARKLTWSAVGREFIRHPQNFATRVTKNFLREAGTEGAQEGVVLSMSGDILHQSVMDTLDEVGFAAVVGGLSTLANIPADRRMQEYEEAAAAVLGMKVSEDSKPLAKSLNNAVNALMSTGLIRSRDAALDLLVKASTPEARERMFDYIKTALDEELSKITPEQMKLLDQLPQFLKDEAANSFRSLDAKVRANLPADMPESDKIVITRAMRGVAAVVGFYTQKQIELPKVVIADIGQYGMTKGTLANYDRATNTIAVARNVSTDGKAYDADYVLEPTRFGPISKRHSSLLHEIGHYLDHQIGRGTNFAKFLPIYFASIAHVYGTDLALKTKKAAPASGSRFDNVDTTKPGMYFNPKNTTEIFAHAIGRMGADFGLALGYKGNVAEALTVANILGQHIIIPEIQAELNAFANDLRNMIVKNSETLKALAEKYGDEELSDAIDRYMAGDPDALEAADIASLLDILSSFVSNEDLGILSNIFDSEGKMETFMEKAKREVKEAAKKGVTEEGERIKKAEADKKAKAKKGEGKLNEEWEGKPDDDTLPLDSREQDPFSADSEVPDAVAAYEADQQETKISGLERRTKRKLNGKDFFEDAKDVEGIMVGAKPMPKWFRKMFGGYTAGDLTISMMILGGKKLVEKFDLMKLFNRSDEIVKNKMAEFNQTLDGMFKNTFERNVFENDCAQDSIDVDGLLRHPLTGQETEVRRISPFVAMNVYLHNKNSATRKNLQNTFINGQAGIDYVISQMTDQQKEYADRMQAFVAKHWKVYRDGSAQLGERVGEEPYWPVAEASHAALGRRRPNPEIARDPNKSYMISMTVDARELFNNYVARISSAEVGLYATIQRIKDLFGYDPETSTENLDSDGIKYSNEVYRTSIDLRAAGMSKFGSEKNYQNFLNLLDDFVSNVETRRVSDSNLNTLARNITTGMLSWKVVQLFKNMTNFSTFWGLAENQRQYWADTMWAASHPREALKYMMDSVPLIKHRWEGKDIDEQLSAATAGGESLWFKLEKGKHRNPNYRRLLSNMTAMAQALKRAGISPMLAGDLIGNVLGGYGLLKEYERKYGDKRIAVDEFSKRVTERQSSSNQAARSLAQREWNRDVRGQFITFTAEQAQKGKSIGLAIAEAQTGERTWGSAIKEVVSTLSGMMAFVLVSAGVIDLFDDDEENDKEVYEAMKRELVGQVLGTHIFGSAFAAPILSRALGGSASTIGTPLTRWLEQETSKLGRGDWEEAVLDGVFTAGGMIGYGSATNVLQGGRRVATGESEEEVEAGLRQLAGRPKRMAEERSGFDKEVEKEDK